ncbi:hypothetical protein F2Q70_00002420 [Brassica cretica]|uniref:Uncharacterized protein n=1 Tax=Brassica cretica TaxID=69181 RepID=A0A8S9IWB4_BRACR|nr:hypothetical protein F2Q70_00002420 [Brassica cretica]KAF3563494.1 hypothetical protein DY000_02013856 [Brassica cretica]
MASNGMASHESNDRSSARASLPQTMVVASHSLQRKRQHMKGRGEDERHRKRDDEGSMKV